MTSASEVSVSAAPRTGQVLAKVVKNTVCKAFLHQGAPSAQSWVNAYSTAVPSSPQGSDGRCGLPLAHIDAVDQLRTGRMRVQRAVQ